MKYKPGAYYWIKVKDDGAWEPGRYEESDGGVYKRFYVCGIAWGIILENVVMIGPRLILPGGYRG